VGDKGDTSALLVSPAALKGKGQERRKVYEGEKRKTINPKMGEKTNYTQNENFGVLLSKQVVVLHGSHLPGKLRNCRVGESQEVKSSFKGEKKVYSLRWLGGKKHRAGNCRVALRRRL